MTYSQSTQCVCSRCFGHPSAIVRTKSEASLQAHDRSGGGGNVRWSVPRTQQRNPSRSEHAAQYLSRREGEELNNVLIFEEKGEDEGILENEE